ncbi:hypothetical protein Ait01nite_100800 [Actinoplanes italicus]|uniref:Tetratricopeptide repeat protein n=1 Tax=Actinoplanes italicus TaxID=113567 RepID=A0A2T0JBB3_9ACTN|nr:tetratricopeptide repeat protein [Actinoplanes italicus]PRX04722.1 tetratricopeptide repeat protein [Actinoplanes italicus]GIE37035.1 hypothetical protein Ait01nite_100800 [Actinoplanes italicus]
MTGADESDAVHVVQNVIAIGGFAYGVINGDLYVHGDGRPVYIVREREPPVVPQTGWLLELPSRLLDARHEVVEFTGRVAELTVLTRWRDSADRLSVLYLHGAAGEGKSRLAARFADRSTADGWKVLEARHGGDTIAVTPESQNLAAGDAPGLLLVVDYADRWPVEHLQWLFANRLLHSPVPTRVLLIGRSVHSWMSLQHALDEIRARSEDLELRPLAGTEDERRSVFDAARSRYGLLYGIAVTDEPPPLHHRDFARVLSLHMAALVAVDAQTSSSEQLSDPARLSAYLLRREHSHWARMHARSVSGFATPPGLLARTAFTAVLAGSQPASAATPLLRDINDTSSWPVDVAKVLTDHGVCYPATGGRLLEPLYPDRLAEDFLALQLPGHDQSGYPVDETAGQALARAVRRLAGDTPVRYLDRALTYLAAAASRWPHAGTRYLFPLLRSDPRLALDLTTALSEIAAVPGMDADLLETIDGVVAEDDAVGRDVARAVLSERLLDSRLAAAVDDLTRSALHRSHASRLNRAGRTEDAVAALDAALAVLGPDDQAADTPVTPAEKERRHSRSAALLLRATTLRTAGRLDDALESATRADRAISALAAADPDRYLLRQLTIRSEMAIDLAEVGQRRAALELATKVSGTLLLLASENRDNQEVHERIAALSNDIAQMQVTLGRTREALQHADLAVKSYRRLAAADPDALVELARALNSHSTVLSGAGRSAEAIKPAEESTRLRRELFAANPARFRSDLAMSLNNQAAALDDLHRYAEALPLINEAIALRRELAARVPARHLADLAMSLRNLSTIRRGSHQYELAAAAAEEAVATSHQADAYHRGRRPGQLPRSINMLADALRRLGDLPRAVDLTRESMELFRQSAAEEPEAFIPDLAMALFEFARVRIEAGIEVDEATLAVREALVLYTGLRTERPSAYIRQLAACQQVLRMAESLQARETSR